MIIIFFVHAFNSLVKLILCIQRKLYSQCFSVKEVDLVREQVQRLVSLPIWEHLVPSRLQYELKAVPKLRKYWNAIQKRDRQDDPAIQEKYVSSICDNVAVMFACL